jgi:hypothetical protein
MRVSSVLSVPGEGVSGKAIVPIVPIVPALGGWLTDELDWPEGVPGVDLERVLDTDWDDVAGLALLSHLA